MNAGRYSNPPDAAKLEESTSRLAKSNDALAAKVGHLKLPPGDPLPSETEFFAALRGRLKAGQAAYGDRSFSREPAELLGELEQEALDIAGWGYVLWCRLQRAKAAAKALEVSP